MSVERHGGMISTGETEELEKNPSECLYKSHMD
jgi:hypothetical protein